MAGAFFIQDHWLTVVTGDREGGNVFEAGLTVQHFHHNAARFRADGVATLILI
jgi:hypothetical protein